MNKLVAATSGLLAAGVVVVGLAMAPAAAAAEETGPDSVACATANAAVLASAIEANRVAGTVGDQQDAVLVGLKDAVEEASDKVDAANADYQAKRVIADKDGATAEQKQAAKDALKVLVDAQADLRVAVANLAAGPQLTPAQKAALDKANAAVADAIAKRAKACELVPLPPVTVTPSPSVTVTVTPPPAVRVPSAIDTGKP